MLVDESRVNERLAGLSFGQARTIDLLCDEYERRRKQGDHPPEVGSFLARVAPELHACLREELAAVEVEMCRQGGAIVEPAILAERFGVEPGLVRSWLEQSREEKDSGTQLPAQDDRSSVLSLLPSTASEPLDWNTQAQTPCLFGEYQLLEKLGEGGMGTVYRARHLRLGRQVAIKVIRPSVSWRREVASRFQREMQAAGMLDHANVIEAQHAGEHAGQLYLVMKLLDGLDLAQLVSRCGPLGAADAAEIIRQGALGLQALHEHGMVHRDIKPSNLMLTREGVVKVLDLGLARLEVEELRSARDLTTASMAVGTLDYMAPEQQDNAASVSIRADIYSLGCVLHFLLMGQPPFGDLPSPLARLAAHRQEQVPSPDLRRPDLPPALLAVLARMLAKTPGERYTEPRLVAEALAPLAAGARLAELVATLAPAAIAFPLSLDAPTTQWRRPRRRWLVRAASAALLVTLAAAGMDLAQRYLVRPPASPHSGGPNGLPASPLTVRGLHLAHHAGVGKQSQLRGEIGVQSFAVRFGDQVRLRAELSGPAYCHLLGLNADGKVQSLWPNDPRARPSLRSHLVFPDVGEGMTLDDEPRGGVQAFVLLAMREPLPSSAEWHRHLPSLPWKRLVVSRPAVWRGTDEELEEVQVHNGQRVHVSSLEGIGPLGESIRCLRSVPGVEALRVVAFMVAPKTDKPGGAADK